MARRIDVERIESRHSTGRNADQRAGLAPPQIADRRRLGRSSEESAWAGRALVGGEREYWQPERECRVVAPPHRSP
jgi:hypothetical protein